MPHVVTVPPQPFSLKTCGLEVHQIPVWQDNLVWALVDPREKIAAVVDGPEAAPVLAYLDGLGLTLTTIFNTHTHGDHVGINHALHDLGRLGDLTVVGAQQTASDIPGLTHPVADGDTVEFAGVTGRAMLTEGHINGHLSFLFDDALFCGDTLFAGGCGYLFDGPPKKMHDSLTRLASLPDETKVCCAHEYTQDNLRFAWSIDSGNPALAQRIRDTWALRGRGECSLPSTIGLERATNPFLRTDDPALVAAIQVAGPKQDLDTPAGVFAATRALKDAQHYRSQDEADLPV